MLLAFERTRPDWGVTEIAAEDRLGHLGRPAAAVHARGPRLPWSPTRRPAVTASARPPLRLGHL
ncbi:hypothetical protein LV779_09025 [Streptomyces thinghirensis]|nr:hypothetical protein [Streptomyces thinghirensis]